MITDQETNFVYLSGLLPKRHPGVFKRLTAALEGKGIAWGLLPDTMDIWCRDYMPIQVSKDRFVQFKYDPIYLKAKKYRATITDTAKVCDAIGIKPVISRIKLDGGNVVSSGTKAIITDRIFSENFGYSKTQLIGELERLLKVRQIIIIPECPGDMTGHADGLVRFVRCAKSEDDLVYISDLSSILPAYFSKLYSALTKAELIPVPMPYEAPKKYDKLDASGTYVNYLQAGKHAFYPVFGSRMNAFARKMFSEFFGSCAVPVNTGKLATEGGVLNCISWNVMR